MPRGPGRARTRGAHLHTLRVDAGLGVRELAAAAGIGPDAISRAERDLQNLSLAATILVATALSKRLGRTITAEDLTDIDDRDTTVDRPAGAA